ncbi:dihydroorotate dehydrogenase electron transfer subunit [Chitinispirillales bacterium ANBcel5]|uniref:dihydroorotate dehydrogenase electron transfer subunit n=1 Tax=Cellulosispirillum alkaliphilum TaxID=3039283 RepID=UPI002A527903|nr:dihydroorotate dehydrogenase electron transfer subunit [Chitinispirillales bacterium ANBcel5]
MKQINSKVIRNQKITSDFYELEFSWDHEAGIPVPGQFLTIRVSHDTVPLLRRPFAFSAFNGETMSASIIYQKRGRATELLCSKEKGETLDLIGPLGNPFPKLPPQKAVLVAGGIGLGPVMFMVSDLLQKNQSVEFVFGCRNTHSVPDAQSFKRLQPVVCTDDGTAGFKGTVIDYLEEKGSVDSKSTIYCCGPHPMLKALNDLADTKKAQCFVSVEQVMACGVGACMGCVVKTTTGYQRACKEGPVFNSRDILWE